MLNILCHILKEITIFIEFYWYFNKKKKKKKKKKTKRGHLKIKI